MAADTTIFNSHSIDTQFQPHEAAIVVLEHLGLLDLEVTELGHPCAVEIVVSVDDGQVNGNLVRVKDRDEGLEILV